MSALDLSVEAQILNLLMGVQDEHDIVSLAGTPARISCRPLSESTTRRSARVSRSRSGPALRGQGVGVMYQGRIVEHGAGRRVFEQPRHPSRQMLLDSVLTLVGRLPGARDMVPTAVTGTACAFAPRCPLVHDRCTTEDPVLEDLVDGHTAACFADYERL